MGRRRKILKDVHGPKCYCFYCACRLAQLEAEQREQEDAARKALAQQVVEEEMSNHG